MKKKILITGVNGFIGRNLYSNLKEEYNVIGIARNAKEVNGIFNIDLLNEKLLLNFIKSEKIDVIIHTASEMASSENIKDINIFHRNNQISINLINALEDEKNLHLINFSSSSVYPNNSGLYSEKSSINPSKNSDCLYGLSKFNSEILFNYLLNSIDKSISITNLRIPMVYGDDMNENRIHKVFEKELLAKNSITTWGGGDRIISHIEINDLCKQVSQLITQNIYGTYNAIGESISLLNLAQRIITEKGNANSRIIKEAKGNKFEFKLDGSSLKKILND